jgi:pyruvate,orthophosphate dikinase
LLLRYAAIYLFVAASVSFSHELGLDYVSCSPFRVPIARLAAAQAALGRGTSSQA